MLKYVAYRTFKKLSCSTCDSQIILQIKPEFALGGINFLNSIIAKEQQQTEESTGKPFWYYEFTYNDTEQLISGHPNLIQDDILGVACKSVLTEYFDFLTLQATESVDRKYFPSQRVGPPSDIGIVTGLAIWTTQTDIKTLGTSFTNTDNKPVWVTFLYETPILVWTLATGAGYSYTNSYTIVNDGVSIVTDTKPLGGFTNTGPDGAYLALPSNLSGIANAFKVDPGKVISITTTLGIDANGVADAGNEIAVYGPWINTIITPADIT